MSSSITFPSALTKMLMRLQSKSLPVSANTRRLQAAQVQVKIGLESGIHVPMTNTRITDLEIYERGYLCIYSPPVGGTRGHR